MRKLLILGALTFLIVAPAKAQDYPKGEVAGVYSYVRFNPGGGLSGFNCHGGGGSVAGNLNSWFGVAGEFSGCKITGLPSGASASTYTYVFGPRITYRTTGKLEPFGEVLLGGSHATASGGGFSGSGNAFAVALGGGVDYKMTQHVAIRLIQADYLMNRSNGSTENDVRVQAGIVYRFGGR
jgi:opacity protein-like surface antigen